MENSRVRCNPSSRPWFVSGITVHLSLTYLNAEAKIHRNKHSRYSDHNSSRLMNMTSPLLFFTDSYCLSIVFMTPLCCSRIGFLTSRNLVLSRSRLPFFRQRSDFLISRIGRHAASSLYLFSSRPVSSVTVICHTASRNIISSSSSDPVSSAFFRYFFSCLVSLKF